MERYACKSMEEWICHLGHQGGIGRALCLPVCYFQKRERERPLPLQTRVWPTMQGNENTKTNGAWTALARTQRHRQKMLKDNNTTTTAHPQRNITMFFSSITFMLRVNQGLHKQGVNKSQQFVVHIVPKHLNHCPITLIINKQRQLLPST